MFDSDLVVASTGTLLVDPAAHVLGSRCCTNPTSTVTVDGTLEVFSVTGATGLTAELDHVGLDWFGAVDVPSDNTLRLTGGPVRVDGASLRGGGTLDVVETNGADFEPLHPEEPDGTLKFVDDGETLTVAEDSTLSLGDFTEVSGTGRITGDGSVRLAGADVRGSLTLDSGVPATTVAGTTTRVVEWDDLPGQRGVLTPGGGLTVVPGSTLRVQGGGRLAVPDGARTTIGGGAILDADGCCTNRGHVTLADDATLRVGGLGSEPAVLRWVQVGGTGTITHSGRSTWDDIALNLGSGARVTGTGRVTGDLATGSARVTPTGVLTIDGDWTPGSGGTYAPTLPASRTGTTAPSRVVVTGTATLAGSIASRGDTRFAVGHQVLALDAATVTGRFRCFQTPGLLPRYAARTVRLGGITARATGCVVPSSGTVLRSTFRGRRVASLGVPAGTTRVLLQVTLGRSSRASTATLTGGGARVSVRAPAGRSVTTTVVVSVSSARRLTATLTQRAGLTVTRLGRL